MIYMTGRELIMYILANKLEDVPVLPSQIGAGFLTIDEAAAQLKVGSATIRAMVQEKKLNSITVGDVIYIIAKVKLEL